MGQCGCGASCFDAESATASQHKGLDISTYMSPSADDTDATLWSAHGGFWVTLRRDTADEELGLDLDLDGNGRSMRISSIDPNKPVAKWNAKVSKDLQVREGDCLVELNGKRRSQAIKNEIRTAIELSILFMRAEEYKVQVDQAGPLGFQFQPWNSADRPCHSLIITKIDPKSLIFDWNQAHQGQPELIVAVHDRIVEVNGKRGSCQLLFDEIKIAGKRTLTLSRCPYLPSLPSRSAATSTVTTDPVAKPVAVDDPFKLHRFCRISGSEFQSALDEIKTGRKESHWSWYFFPVPPFVVNGNEIGSQMNREWALRDKPPNDLRGDDAARAFLRFESGGVNLRQRLIAMMSAVIDKLDQGVDPLTLVGEADDPKLRSSLRLFECVSRDGFDVEVNALCRKGLTLLTEQLEEDPADSAQATDSVKDNNVV